MSITSEKQVGKTAAQPPQQDQRHSLNTYFCFVEPITPNNKKSILDKYATNSNWATTNLQTRTSMHARIAKETRVDGEKVPLKKGQMYK